MSNSVIATVPYPPVAFRRRNFRDGIVRRIEQLGWEGVSGRVAEQAHGGSHAGRRSSARPDQAQPAIAEEPRRADEVIARLRAILLSVGNDGLVASNEEFVQWMCGRRTIRYVGTSDDTLVRLIDFDNVEANILRVTTEATFRAGREWRRFDVVLWINGCRWLLARPRAPPM